MPSKREIVAALGLPPNTKARQVYNRAIRQCVPGGAEVLDRLEKLDYMRVRDQANPQFAAEVGKLIEQRDRMTQDLLGGRVAIPGIPATREQP